MGATGKKPTDADSLEEFATLLESRAEKLREYAEALRSRKKKTIEVSNRTMAESGLKEINKYIVKIQTALGIV